MIDFDYDEHDEEKSELEIKAEAKAKRLKLKKQKQKLEQDLNDWKAILSTPHGRRVMWGILAKANIYQLSFNVAEHAMYFNEGRRSLGLDLLFKINTVMPDAWLLMQKENSNE